MKNTENSIDKAIPRDSDDADFYYNRGTDKMNLGQYKESIADFDTAIQINPNNPNFYYSRGAAKEKFGQSEDSLPTLWVLGNTQKRLPNTMKLFV